MVWARLPGGPGGGGGGYLIPGFNIGRKWNGCVFATLGNCSSIFATTTSIILPSSYPISPSLSLSLSLSRARARPPHPFTPLPARARDCDSLYRSTGYPRCFLSAAWLGFAACWFITTQLRNFYARRRITIATTSGAEFQPVYNNEAGGYHVSSPPTTPTPGIPQQTRYTQQNRPGYVFTNRTYRLSQGYPQRKM